MAPKKNKPAPAVQTTDVVEQPVETKETVLQEEETKVEEPAPAVQTTIGTITQEVISSSYTAPIEDESLVKVLVKYPEGFKGTRYLKDGKEYKVSAETAALYEKRGIATIVK